MAIIMDLNVVGVTVSKINHVIRLLGDVEIEHHVHGLIQDALMVCFFYIIVDFMITDRLGAVN